MKRFFSDNLFNRVSSQTLLLEFGDYYIDLENGLVYSFVAPDPGSTIRYEYISDQLIAKSSPVIIHNIQSDDYQTKMFEQILDENGDTRNGLPTALGADIINELLSVRPITWGS